MDNLAMGPLVMDGLAMDQAAATTRRARSWSRAWTRCVACLVVGAWVASGVRPHVLAQVRLDEAAKAVRVDQAMLALDRYLETWNSRDATRWATSLHFPHVRPGAGPFEMSATPAQYIASVNFAQTLSTGWHHSEWISRQVLQVGLDKVHIAGSWRRFTEAGQAQATSAITYVLTQQNGHWGVQARFAAGTGEVDEVARARNEAAARSAIDAYFSAWNGHDPVALSAAIHFPHVRIADGGVEVSRTAQEFLAGPEPGRQRTWYRTRVDSVAVVQTTTNGVNVVVGLSKMGRGGDVLSRDEGVFLVALRDGAWRVQARSTFGT